LASDREAVKAAFLAGAGLSRAERHPLPGDASTRRYERLALPDGRTLMLMDAPPAAESKPCPPDASAETRQAAGYNALARLAAGRVDAFAAAAGYLRTRGLSAPEVVALDADQGLAVTEDLGEGLYARLIEAGQDERELYLAAIEALARLHAEPAPAVLEADGGVRWPLLAYDALALKTGADLFVEWLPRFDPRVSLDADAVAEWDALWAPLRARAEAGANVFIHRDYHAENLLWLPGRKGAARVGMIDFQDALRAHPSWDLHSLLQDARRDVDPALEQAALDHYFALRPEVDREAFMADYAALATLNEARILGIFSRLVVHDGKPRYQAFMPRMWRHITRNLDRPEMAGMKAWFERNIPAEVRS
jgi:aminoglycoside/choline kinase family phosphotransferase